jgi:hypothetical protein
MQVNTPRAWPRDDGDFGVRHNGGNGRPFATVELDEFGNLEIVLQSTGDCDRLIKAVAAAKTLLIEHADDKDKPHAYRAAPGFPCLTCGQPRDGHPSPDADPANTVPRVSDVLRDVLGDTETPAAPATPGECGARRALDGLKCDLPAGHLTDPGDGRKHEAWTSPDCMATWTDAECAPEASRM